MQRSLIPGHNNNRHLTNDEIENNIGGLPVTDNRIQELFDNLDSEHTGLVSLDAVKQFYLGLEHYGLEPSDREVDELVRKYATTTPDGLTYDEFSCFVLGLAQCLIPGHNNNRHLTNDEIENNIGGLPVTDNRIQELFDNLDSEHTGLVSLDAVKQFYLGLEHYGLEPSDREVDELVRKYATTTPDGLTYDEFSCFVLGLAQW